MLAMCKRHYISIGRGSTLIRLTLTSFPIYFMSLLCMPQLSRLRLEHIQIDFLWGDRTFERRPHLVRWAIVCSNKKKRGLGVKHLSSLN